LEIVDGRNAARYRWEIEEAGRCIAAGAVESAVVPLGLTVQVMEMLDRCRTAAGIENSAAA
jgi:hypothetical protein